MGKRFSSEQSVREFVKDLKGFYSELSAYVIICMALVILWLLSGAGYFWPIWVILIWGVSLLLKASKLSVIDKNIYEWCCQVRHSLPFMRSDWEEEKYKELSKLIESTSESADEKKED